MIDIVAIVKQQQDLAKKIAEQKELEAKAVELKKEKDELQSKFDALQSSVDKLQDKAVAQTTSTSTPAPAKSKTLMYAGLLAGGLVLGYFITKMVSK